MTSQRPIQHPPETRAEAEIVLRPEAGGSVVQVSLHGPLTEQTVTLVAQEVLLLAPNVSVLLDLSSVHACDPAAAVSLVQLNDRVRRRGGRCFCVAPSYPVARALRTFGMARHLRICPSLEAAREALQRLPPVPDLDRHADRDPAGPESGTRPAQ